MGPYSHYQLAIKLAPFLKPGQSKEYIWGAVAPDIRYLANMHRDHTHLSQDRLRDLMSRYPSRISFLIGYQVHVLIDQVDVPQIVASAFPLKYIQKALHRSISPQLMTMMVEMHYLQSGNPGETLSGMHNQVLAELGIHPEQTRVFQEALQEYFEKRSFDAAIAAFQKIGMVQNSRMEKYLNAYRRMQKQKVLSALFLLSVKNAGLDARLMTYVQSSLANQVDS